MTKVPQDHTIRAAFWVLTSLILLGLAILVWPFFTAIFGAVVLSILMHPFYLRFRKKWSENFSSLMVVLLTLFVIVLPGAILGTVVSAQAFQAVSEFESSAPPGQKPYSVDRIVAEFDARLTPLIRQIGFSDFRFSRWFNENRKEIGKNLSGPIGRLVFQTLHGLLMLVIALLTMFFMLRDGHKLKEPALELLPLPHAESEQILSRVGETIRAVFVGVVLVAIVQGALAGLAYFIAGVPWALLWMLMTMLLCAVPLLGAPVIYIPMSLMLLAQGKVWQGLFLLIFGFVVVSQADNILRPFVIGGRTGLHPMAVFFSLLGGILALGPIGIMAGPVLLTLGIALLDIIRTKRMLEEAGT